MIEYKITQIPAKARSKYHYYTGGSSTNNSSSTSVSIDTSNFVKLKGEENQTVEGTIIATGDLIAYDVSEIDTGTNPIIMGLDDLVDVDLSAIDHTKINTLILNPDTTHWTVSEYKIDDTGGLTEVNWDDILNKPTEFKPKTHIHIWDDITGKPKDYKPSAHSHSKLRYEDNIKAEAVSTGLNVEGNVVATGDVIAFNVLDTETTPVIMSLDDLVDVDLTGIDTLRKYTLTKDIGSNHWKFSEYNSGGLTSVSWGDINNKPTEFTPSPHNHYLSQIDDLHNSWDALLKSSPSSFVTRHPSWEEVTSKPDKFPSSPHTHPYLPLTGGTITGNLRLKRDISAPEGNYGNKINFGDSDFVYLHEYEDDKLRIKGDKIIDLVTGELLLNGGEFTVNKLTYNGDTKAEATNNGVNITGDLIATGDIISYDLDDSLAGAFKYWRPYVNSNGYISWSNSTDTSTPSSVYIKGQKGDRGLTGATGSQGPRGYTGQTGSQGPKGDTGTISTSDFVTLPYNGSVFKRSSGVLGVKFSGGNGILGYDSTLYNNIGNLYLNYTSAGNVQITPTAQLIASGGVSSDKRLKTELQDTSISLSDIIQLNPKSYYYKNDIDFEHRELGLIAQDLLGTRLEPFVISHLNENEEEYYAINYSQLGAVVAVQSAKELKLICDKQQEEINTLKLKNQELENKINTIMNQLNLE